MIITSRDNPAVRLTRRLLNEASQRRAQGLFVIEGIRLCCDAVISGVKIKTVLYTSQARKNYAPDIAVLSDTGAQMAEISPELSKLIADTQTPQGVFCICELLDNDMSLDTIIDNKNPITGYLAMENIRDPANMGAIIRTAEALGIDCLFISDGCCDIYNPKVLRGSMGGVFRLPIIAAGNMASAIKRLTDSGIDCYACVADRHADLIQNAGLKPGSVCVIGNEGSGLTCETAVACSKRITIPMAGRAQSLNAAMAAGIVIWEMTKGLRG